MPEASARAIQSFRWDLRKLCLGETKGVANLLHVVCGGQRLIEAQCLLESGAFVSLVVEVFGILQEEPASPFQKRSCEGGQ